MTPAPKLKPLDTMISSKLSLISKTLGLVVKALDAMNNSRLGLK